MPSKAPQAKAPEPAMVKDLVAGSGLRFEPRGVHTLKAVPGEWALHLALHE